MAELLNVGEHSRAAPFHAAAARSCWFWMMSISPSRKARLFGLLGRSGSAKSR